MGVDVSRQLRSALFLDRLPRGVLTSVLVSIFAASIPASAERGLRLSGVSAQGGGLDAAITQPARVSTKSAPRRSPRPGERPEGLTLGNVARDEAPAIGGAFPVAPAAADAVAASVDEGAADEAPLMAGDATSAPGQPAQAQAEAGSALSMPAAETSAPAVERPAMVSAPPVMPPRFNLAPWTLAGFGADRAALNSAQVAAGPDERPARAMDLAEFYLAQAMLPEGLSVMSSLDPSALAPVDAARFRALDAALRMAAGARAPADAPVGPAYADWPDAAFWSLLAGVRAGDLAALGPQFDDALRVLDGYSPQLAKQLLPALLEAATDAGAWAASGEIAARMADDPELRASAAYDFLLGRAAQAAGQGEDAFDAYVRAAAGRDVYAQRARIALADMGLEGGPKALRQTRDMIADMRYRWRGGQLELDMLMRLATVDDRLHDRAEALAVMGEILRLFPGTPEAERISARADALLDEVYAEGASGKLPLPEFLALHRRVSPDFRLIPGFDRQAERLAQRLAAIGASASAADEYGQIRAALRNGVASGAWPEDADRDAELRLEQAAALLEGGQAADAELLLASDEPVPAALEDRRGELLARALLALGRPDQALSVSVAAPNADYLRLQADTYRARSDWAAAATRYGQLQQRFPEQFEFADAVGLFLSQYQLRRYDEAAAVVADFPRLTETSEWQQIAAAILASPSDLAPLRERAAKDRLQGAVGALEQIGATGVGAAPVAQGLPSGS